MSGLNIAPSVTSNDEELTRHSQEELRWAWDIHCYAESMFSQRMNYGMVAQSMLLLSFVTLFVYQYYVPRYSVALEIVVTMLGLGYSAFQYVRGLSLTSRIGFLQMTYLKEIPAFQEYMNAHNFIYVLFGHTFRLRLRHQHIAKGLFIGWFALLSIALATVALPPVKCPLPT